jgi:hypothetical protein
VGFVLLHRLNVKIDVILSVLDAETRASFLPRKTVRIQIPGLN